MWPWDQAILTILDEGRGIPPEQLEEVFTPYRSHDKDGLPYQSPGLGPPLARRVLEAHGGSPAAYQQRGRYCRGLLAAAVPELPTRAARLPHYLRIFSPRFTPILCDYITPAMASTPSHRDIPKPRFARPGPFILSAGRGIQAAGRFGFAETRGLRPRRRFSATRPAARRSPCR